MRFMMNDFTGGLIDDDLHLRSDLEDYSKSLLVADNVTPLITGGLKKRPGTTTISRGREGIKYIHPFTEVLIQFDDTHLHIAGQSFEHIFTDVTDLRIVSTKDRAFILQKNQTTPIPIFELRYFKSTTEYTFEQFIFRHPALESNLTARSPATFISLDKLTGNVTATAQLYTTYNSTVTYFLDDIFIVVKTETEVIAGPYITTNSIVTSYKVITPSATNIPPTNNLYEEQNTNVYERLGSTQYPTHSTTTTYHLDDTVYYRGSYFKATGTTNTLPEDNNNPPVTNSGWVRIQPEAGDLEADVFVLEDLGKYLQVNQGVMLIEAVLDRYGNPATIDSVNNKVRGKMLVDAVAKEAIKDSWFIKVSALEGITDITLLQQRLVVSTEDTVYFSKVADYNNFLQSSVTLTADAFSVAINSNITTTIKYMTPWRNGIVVHTDRSEFYVYSETLISALSIRAEESVFFAITDCEPIQVQGDILYLTKDRLRAVAFDRDKGGLISISLSDQIRIKERVLKILSYNDLIYLLTPTFLYCILYDKTGQIVAFSKHIHTNPIKSIALIDDTLYLLTDSKILRQDEGIYTDETEYVEGLKETGMVGYNTYTYTVDQDDSDKFGYQYPVNVKTTNIDYSKLAQKATKIDEVQRVTDIVVHLHKSSHVVINEEDLEIPNNTTGTVIMYPDNMTTQDISYNDPDRYRVRVSSLSPFDFYIKGISINGK